MRVVICGGGVIGAATAYFLSRRGVAPLVVEPVGVACAASGKSGHQGIAVPQQKAGGGEHRESQRPLQQQPAGRAQLPAAYHADFDRILQAFREVEAGQDEPAKTTLQGISLRSPFLEWKLLLRGLLAYYQNDDAKALENFQRLAPERVPARLAASFRQALDPNYRFQIQSTDDRPDVEIVLLGKLSRAQPVSNPIRRGAPESMAITDDLYSP